MSVSTLQELGFQAFVNPILFLNQHWINRRLTDNFRESILFFHAVDKFPIPFHLLFLSHNLHTIDKMSKKESRLLTPDLDDARLFMSLTAGAGTIRIILLSSSPNLQHFFVLFFYFSSFSLFFE